MELVQVRTDPTNHRAIPVRIERIDDEAAAILWMRHQSVGVQDAFAHQVLALEELQKRILDLADGGIFVVQNSISSCHDRICEAMWVSHVAKKRFRSRMANQKPEGCMRFEL